MRYSSIKAHSGDHHEVITRSRTANTIFQSTSSTFTPQAILDHAWHSTSTLDHLTRYYCGDWENVAQRMARENGQTFQIVRPDDGATEETVTDPLVISDTVGHWRKSLSRGLAENLTAPLSWIDSQHSDYLTDRPGWTGYSALVLLAAQTEHPKFDLPAYAPKEWANHPAYQAATTPQCTFSYSQLLMPELWLPGDFNFIFKAEDVAGKMVWMGSTIQLERNLRSLNADVLRGSDDDCCRWRSDGLPADDEFMASARFGLALFLSVVGFAVRNHVPM